MQLDGRMEARIGGGAWESCMVVEAAKMNGD